MEHPYPNLVWNNEALRQQVLETELEAAQLRLAREKGNCPSCAALLARVAVLEKALNDQAQTIEALLADKHRLADTVTAQVEEMKALRSRVAGLEEVAAGNALTNVCPFCYQDDFDKVGLKHHLLAGYCDDFNGVAALDAAKEEK